MIWVWVIITCIFILLFINRKESFTLEFKTKFGPPTLGISSFVSAASGHATNLQSAMWQMIPFRSRLRDLHRQYRRRKFFVA